MSKKYVAQFDAIEIVIPTVLKQKQKDILQLIESEVKELEQ